MKLRVGTWNIRGGRGSGDQLPVHRTRFLNEIADKIAATRLQAVMLQEVDCLVARSGWVDQGRYLAKRLTLVTGERWHHLFATAIYILGGRYGNAILSSLPLSRRLVLPLQHPGMKVEDRVFLYALVKLPDGGSCGLGTFHLSVANRWLRLREVERIKHALSTFFPLPPLVIGGDLNETREGKIYPAIRERQVTLTDLGPVEGYSFGPPGSTYQERIDFLLGYRVDSLEAGIVEAGTGSDHHLVWAECEPHPGPWD